MDDNNRNLILATVLSFLVILVWYTVFAPTPPEPTAPQAETTITQDNAGGVAAPGANTEAAAGGAELGTQAGSNDPTAAAQRVTIKSPSLSGSISLAGGRIDDLLLRDYRETLSDTSPLVRLLSPTSPNNDQQIATTGAKPYYAVYGWMPAAGTDPALVPGPATVWQVESGDRLAPGQPVTLVWDNGAGQIFRRVFELDDHYLFTVTQSLQNNDDAAFAAAPYGIIARHGHPDTQNFFVLHEGVVGMHDGELIEEDYDNIAELDPVDREGRAQLFDVAENGWIGFTDKYWMTTLAPAPGQPFTAVAKHADGVDIYQTEARFPVETAAPARPSAPAATCSRAPRNGR